MKKYKSIVMVVPVSLKCAFLEIESQKPQDVIAILQQFGFCERVHRDERLESRLFTQDDTRIFLKQTMGQPRTLTPFLDSTVTRIGLFVEEECAGVQDCLPLSCDHDLISPIGVAFHILTRSQWRAWEKVYVLPEDITPTPLIHDIDHVAMNVSEFERQEMSAWCQLVLGMHEIDAHTIQGARTSFECSPLESGCGHFSLVLNTSQDPDSQISRYITQAGGAGIQHVAFSATDLPQTLKTLRARAVPFINVPAIYYDALIEKGVLNDSQRALFQDNSLLLDKEVGSASFLAQTFTQDLLGPFFLEIIQRHDRRGFGQDNIQALFKAVESLQA